MRTTTMILLATLVTIAAVAAPVEGGLTGSASASQCMIEDLPEDTSCWERQVRCTIKMVTSGQYCPM